MQEKYYYGNYFIHKIKLILSLTSFNFDIVFLEDYWCICLGPVALIDYIRVRLSGNQNRTAEIITR